MMLGLNLGARSLEVREEMLMMRGLKGVVDVDVEEARRMGRRRRERERGAW